MWSVGRCCLSHRPRTVLSADDAYRPGDDRLASRFRRLARFKRRPRFPGPRSDANGSGKKHGFALADHQVVFAGTEFVANTLNQVRVHGPLGEKRLYRLARAVNLIDVHGLIPFILRLERIKAVPGLRITVHWAYFLAIPVCVLIVFGSVLVGVLTSVSPYGACQSALNWFFPA